MLGSGMRPKGQGTLVGVLHPNVLTAASMRAQDGAALQAQPRHHDLQHRIADP